MSALIPRKKYISSGKGKVEKYDLSTFLSFLIQFRFSSDENVAFEKNGSKK